MKREYKTNRGINLCVDCGKYAKWEELKIIQDSNTGEYEDLVHIQGTGCKK